jgi:hypothetical protein
MLLRTTVLGLALSLAGCPAPSAPSDAGTDAFVMNDAARIDAAPGLDASGSDAGLDAASVDAATNDAVLIDGTDAASVDSPAPLDAAATSVTLALDGYTLSPGGEAWKCQNFASPFGVDVDVDAFTTTTADSVIELRLFEEPGLTDGPLTDCSGLELAQLHFITQEIDGALTYPAGVAAHITAGSGLRVSMHLMNTTAGDVSSSVRVTMHLVPAASVTSHAGMLFIPEVRIDVPPMAVGTATHDCHLPDAMTLLGASAVTFGHSTEVVATLGGSTIYDSTSWQHAPLAPFAPPIDGTNGEALHFACSYANPSAGALSFGESSTTNEMCNFYMPFYGPLADAAITVACP